MKVLSYFGRTALIFTVLWGALIAISYVLFPPSQVQLIDTQQYKETIFDSTPKWVAYGLDPLRRPGPKAIVIGASNAREGLRPKEISNIFHGEKVYNLSVDAANVTALSDIVSLVYDKVPPQHRNEITFVAGIWYGLFGSDESRWGGGPSNVQIELSRYGLWNRGPDGKYRPVLSSALMPYALAALRPILMFRHYYLKILKDPAHDARIALRDWFIARDLSKPLANYRHRQVERIGRTIGPQTAMQWIAIQHWRDQLGSDAAFPTEQLRKLERLSRYIADQGSKLILVQLPIPKWHIVAPVPYHREYQLAKRRYLDRIADLPGVTIVDLTDLDRNSDFIDEVHPTPEARARWASILAHVLRFVRNGERIKAANATASNPLVSTKVK